MPRVYLEFIELYQGIVIEVVDIVEHVANNADRQNDADSRSHRGERC